jgi:hypothetical protein
MFDIRAALFFGIPAVICIAIAIWLDSKEMMWVGTGFLVIAGAIFAFDQIS